MILALTSSFTCPTCSGNRVELPETYTDDSPVKCADCGADLGRWGDVRDTAGPVLSKRAEQDVKDALKSLPAAPNK
jgi:hypothetical protein